MSHERKKTHLKYFKVWGCLVNVNIPLNENKKKTLVIYSNKFLEMFPLNDKLTKLSEIPLVLFLPYSDNIICVSSSYDHMSNFLRLLNDILM